MRLLYVPGTRPSALYSSYDPPSSLKRQCHYYLTLQLRKLTCRGPRRARKKHEKLVLRKSRKAVMATMFHVPPPTTSTSNHRHIWKAGSKTKFSNPPKRKGKSPRPEGTAASSLPKNGLFRHWHPADSGLTEVPLLL